MVHAPACFEQAQRPTNECQDPSPTRRVHGRPSGAVEPRCPAASPIHSQLGSMCRSEGFSVGSRSRAHYDMGDGQSALLHPACLAKDLGRTTSRLRRLRHSNKNKAADCDSCAGAGASCQGLRVRLYDACLYLVAHRQGPDLPTHHSSHLGKTQRSRRNRPLKRPSMPGVPSGRGCEACRKQKKKVGNSCGPGGAKLSLPVPPHQLSRRACSYVGSSATSWFLRARDVPASV